MIGILNAYHFEIDSEYQKEYSRLFYSFVQNTFSESKVVEYKVAQGEFPKSISECELWFITGSPKSVYEDIAWIHRLTDFVKELDQNRRKTIGICFGHQMVAHALGGEVRKSSKGWGVGIREFQIEKKQKWMVPALDTISVLFTHQDQVEKIPPRAVLLASDFFCPHQMYQIGEHILTMQGHPELSVEFAKERLLSQKSTMTSEVFDSALHSYNKQNDCRIISFWIRNFSDLKK